MISPGLGIPILFTLLALLVWCAPPGLLAVLGAVKF